MIAAGELDIAMLHRLLRPDLEALARLGRGRLLLAAHELRADLGLGGELVVGAPFLQRQRGAATGEQLAVQRLDDGERLQPGEIAVRPDRRAWRLRGGHPAESRQAEASSESDSLGLHRILRCAFFTGPVFNQPPIHRAARSSAQARPPCPAALRAAKRQSLDTVAHTLAPAGAKSAKRALQKQRAPAHYETAWPTRKPIHCFNVLIHPGPLRSVDVAGVAAALFTYGRT
jgi:hypothetical protein